MIQNKALLIWKIFLIATVLCFTSPSKADDNSCIWCNYKCSEDFMKCITQRIAINPKFKDFVSSLNVMKTNLLKASKAITMKGPMKGNIMKGSLTYALSELMGMENHEEKIIDITNILERCYRVVNKIPDRIFLDEFSKTTKIILEEKGKMPNEQKLVDQVQPDEISEIGQVAKYPPQNKNDFQQLEGDSLTDGSIPQNQQTLSDTTTNSLSWGTESNGKNEFQYKKQPKGEDILQQPNLDQGIANPLIFSGADSYAAIYQPSSINQQSDFPVNAFQLKKQSVIPLNPSVVYNQQYQENKNVYESTYQGYPKNYANNKNYLEQSIIPNDEQNSQSYGKKIDYYRQNQNPKTDNGYNLKDKYPENQPSWSNTATNAGTSIYTYNGPQNNNGYYLPNSESSVLAAPQGIYYKYPSDNSDLKFLPKPSNKIDTRNRNTNLFINKSISQSNTNQKNILSGKDDKTAKALKFSQTLFIVLKDAIYFKKIYHEYTNNGQVLLITPYILYDALSTCGYPENTARTLADTSISFMKSFPEGSPTPSYAEAFCKMIMVLFNFNDLIGDDPETQAKELGNALLISLKNIVDSIQNNKNKLDVLSATQSIKDDNRQPQKLPEKQVVLIEKPVQNYDDTSDSNDGENGDYSDPKALLKNKTNKKFGELFFDIDDIRDEQNKSDYIDNYDENADDYDDGYSSVSTDGNYDDGYDDAGYDDDGYDDDGYDDDGYDDDYDDDFDDDYDDYDDESGDINPENYLPLPTKKEEKQPITLNNPNYGKDNNKDIGQLSSEKLNYFIADEQQKSKSLDDDQKNTNTEPVNGSIKKPDKQIDFIDTDVPVSNDLKILNSKDNINARNKDQSKERVKILIKWGLDCAKDGKFDYETYSDVTAELIKLVQNTNPDLGFQKSQINVLIETVFALSQLLLKSNIKEIRNTLQQSQKINEAISDGLKTLSSKQIIPVQNLDQSIDRVKALMNKGLDCIKEGKFDYNTYSSVIAALAKDVKNTNPDWDLQKSQTVVLVETVFALMQLLLTSNITEIKDTLQQTQKINVPVLDDMQNLISKKYTDIPKKGNEDDGSDDINPKDDLNLSTNEQNKILNSQNIPNYDNGYYNKDIGRLIADEQEKSTSLDDDQKNNNIAPVNDFIQKPDKQIDLIKSDISVSKDLHILDSKENVNVPQSKDRVKILMKRALDCVKNGKFDYKTYGDVIAEIEKRVQDTNPDLGPQKSQTTVLIETVFALTQLLLKSDVKEIKDNLQQSQKMNALKFDDLQILCSTQNIIILNKYQSKNRVKFLMRWGLDCMKEGTFDYKTYSDIIVAAKKRVQDANPYLEPQKSQTIVLIETIFALTQLLLSSNVEEVKDTLQLSQKINVPISDDLQNPSSEKNINMRSKDYYNYGGNNDGYYIGDDDDDGGSYDINPQDYFNLSIKKGKKQPITENKPINGNVNNKDTDQLPSEQPNYLIADEQQKSKSLDDKQETINTEPVNDFIRKPDKQTELIKSDVSVPDDLQNLNSKENIDVLNKDQSKERVKILMKMGLDCIKEGKFDYEKYSNVIVVLTNRIQNTNLDLGLQKLQARVLIETIFALTQLLLKSNIKELKDNLQQFLKMNVLEFDDLQNLSSKQNIIIPNGYQSKNRVKFLMKWGLDCTKEGTFDYKTYSDIIVALTKSVRITNPDLGSQKSQSIVLIETIFALTQLLLNSNVKEVKGTLQQSQNVNVRILDDLQNPNSKKNIKSKDYYNYGGDNNGYYISDVDDDGGNHAINPEDYFSLPSKKGKKQPITENKPNNDNDDNTDTGELPSEQSNYFIADEQQKIESLDVDQKNIKTAPINDFPDKQIDLTNGDVPVSNDLQNVNSNENTKILQSKDRVQILMKWGLDCIKDDKFDYKTYSGVIAELAEFVQDTNPDWGPQKSQTKVLTETILALTQLLIKSNIKEIKDTLEQPLKIAEPVSQLSNNQNNYLNVQKNNPNIDYQILQKSENVQPAIQSEILNQPIIDYSAPKENIAYPPQNQIQNNLWGNDYDRNQNAYPVIQDTPASQVETLNSVPQQTILTAPQNQAQDNIWNVDRQPWQSNQNSFSQMRNNNANAQQFLQQTFTPGKFNPNQRKWNLNELSFAIAQIVNSNAVLPKVNDVPYRFNNQGNLPVFQQNGVNNPRLMQNRNQFPWIYPENTANISSLIQTGNPAFSGIQATPVFPNDLNNPTLVQSGNPGLTGTQENLVSVTQNDQGSSSLLRNRPQDVWALAQQSGMNTKNSMQPGNQGFTGFQGNLFPLIPSGRNNLNIVQNGQSGMNTQNSKQSESQGFGGINKG